MKRNPGKALFVICLMITAMPMTAWCGSLAVMPDSLAAASDSTAFFSDFTAELPDSAALTDSRVSIEEELSAELRDSLLFQSFKDSVLAGKNIPEDEPDRISGRQAGRSGRLSVRQRDSILTAEMDSRYDTGWTPVPRKATLLSMLLPCGGQIYNRKYWKLPIFYGGYVGCLYALTWNNQMYHDYMDAYTDIMDDDPETKSYEDFLPPRFDVESNMSWLKNVLKTRKDTYRRYRDMSIFCFAGVYLLTIVDAYVDAELSHFDISEDLSLRVNPGIMDTQTASLGLNLSLTF